MSIKLTEDKVQAIFTHASANAVEDFTNTFNVYADKFGFSKTVHVNFFLAQLREEVGPSLIPRRENLNYSCAALTKLFSYYKRNPNNAKRDGRCKGHRANQEVIANKVYKGRLGNTKSGDGQKYRGGGFIQLTGKSNYKMASKVISLALGKTYTVQDVVDNIKTTKGALLTAMAFWAKNKIYNCDNIDCVTRKVNKYTKSYSKRKKHYQLIAKL